MKDDLIARLHWGFLKKPDGGHYPVNPDGPEAANEIERLRAELASERNHVAGLRAENARLREALEDHVRAAECIRHWHDTLGDEGMVVSAEHVRLLWEATSQARAALAEKEK